MLAGLSKPPRRIVVLSSRAEGFYNPGVKLDDLHFTKGRKYTWQVAYAQSKFANVLFAKEL